MTRPPVLRAYIGPDEILVDLFAGGGGASTGIALALGRSPDVAINHSPEAIALHAANHPTTKHYVADVFEVSPIAAVAGRPVALLWLSPDCTHHSKAKGGKPRDQKLRSLADVGIEWAELVRPRVIALENVEEWLDWGPLDEHGNPIKERKGELFREWRDKLVALGYVVEWRLLRACDYGAPTTRRRMVLVARCDGLSIAWPEPTHAAGKAGQLALGERDLAPHRTAAECIDWSIPCPSIFDRARPLADKTMARIARGVRKFVLESARPFVIAVNHGGIGRTDLRVHDLDAPMPTVTGGQRGGHALISPIVVPAKTHGGGGNGARSSAEPLRTITASPRGEFAIAVPYLVHRSNGERVGQSPRIYDAARPLGTIVAQGQKHALCTAFLAKHFGARRPGEVQGGAVDAPFATVTQRDHHALVAAHVVKFQQNSDGTRPDEPLHTVMAGATRFGLVASFLTKYQGTSTGSAVDAPTPTVTASGEHLGLVTVTIDGEEYAIVDIGMRMLTPRELFRAQGFADDYVIDPIGPKGKPLTKTAQIRACGNSVPPPLSHAVVRAQFARAA